ncbi:MAG: methyltransferase domain-containing protein [Candidatus Odinarchaeota archaeon]
MMSGEHILAELAGFGNDVKSCCANFYENNIIQVLLGNSFHPGGLELTRELGNKLGLKPSDTILDLGSGLGSTALFLAKEFGSNVIGLDLSIKNTKIANDNASNQDLAHLCQFKVGDAEKLPFQDKSFDAVISECSFCIFPEKNVAAAEIFRVLKKNGRFGVSDVAIEKKLPIDVQQIVFRVACIADALTSEGYLEVFKNAGFVNLELEDKKEVVYELAGRIKKKIFLAELAKGLKKIVISNIDLKKIKYWLDKAINLVDCGYGTYILVTGVKE